jgi:hypothetical protein
MQTSNEKNTYYASGAEQTQEIIESPEGEYAYLKKLLDNEYFWLDPYDPRNTPNQNAQVVADAEAKAMANGLFENLEQNGLLEMPPKKVIEIINTLASKRKLDTDKLGGRKINQIFAHYKHAIIEMNRQKQKEISKHPKNQRPAPKHHSFNPYRENPESKKIPRKLDLRQNLIIGCPASQKNI